MKLIDRLLAKVGLQRIPAPKAPLPSYWIGNVSITTAAFAQRLENQLASMASAKYDR